MGNCCKDEKTSIEEKIIEDALQKMIAESLQGSGELANSGASVIAIEEQDSIDEYSRVSYQSKNEKSHQETSVTNEHSMENYNGNGYYRQNQIRDEDSFPFVPPSNRRETLKEGRSQRYSLEFKPHRFSSNEEDDLRGTMINYQQGNRYQAGLSVITEVNAIWQSSEARSQLNSSQSNNLRGTDRFSRGSVFLKTSIHSSQLSNASRPNDSMIK